MTPFAFRIVDRWQDLADVDFAAFGDGEIPYWDVDTGKLTPLPLVYTLASDRLTFTGQSLYHVVTGDLVNGIYLRKFDIATADSPVDFNWAVAKFTNPGDGTRDNVVVRFGWNIAPGGGREVSAKPINGIEFESYYHPGSNPRTETHFVCSSDSGGPYRPISFECFNTGSNVNLQFGATSYSFQNRDLTYQFFQCSPSGSAAQWNLASGALFSKSTNNQLWLQQLNAAGNGNVELMRLDSSDRVALAPAGGSTRAVGNLEKGGSGGSTLALKQATELVTVGTGAFTDSSADLLPADSFIVGVVARVTVQPSGTASLQIGDASTADKFADAGTSSVAGTTSNSFAKGTPTAPFVQAAAGKVRITPNAAPSSNDGRVRVVVFYYDMTAPTS